MYLFDESNIVIPKRLGTATESCWLVGLRSYHEINVDSMIPAFTTVYDAYQILAATKCFFADKSNVFQVDMRIN